MNRKEFGKGFIYLPFNMKRLVMDFFFSFFWGIFFSYWFINFNKDPQAVTATDDSEITITKLPYLVYLVSELFLIVIYHNIKIKIYYFNNAFTKIMLSIKFVS